MQFTKSNKLDNVLYDILVNSEEWKALPEFEIRFQ